LPNHNHGGTAGRRLSTIGILLLLLTILPGLVAAQQPTLTANSDETLLLEVQINGFSTNKVGEFTLRHDKLFARPEELLDLGFRLPASITPSSDGLIALLDLPGLTLSLDQKTQELYVTISDNRLIPTLVRPEPGDDSPGHRVIDSGTGITLNYDMVGTYTSSQAGGTGDFGLRAFSPRGILSSDWLTYAGADTAGSGSNTAVRLDSTYTFADVNTMRRYNLGDFITGGLAWTRPVHMEGAQLYSDFSTRPDLVTFPLPTITGSAAAPSTIDVLANGNVMVSSTVAAGPFQVPQLPVVTGAGTLSLTVTNALGQQVNVTQPFYASSSLLAPGLQTYALQAGAVRLEWGSRSNEYGTAAGSAIYRRGLTSKLTLEGSAEATAGTFMGGAGGVLQIGNLGVLNFAASASGGSGNTGAQYSLGAQRIARIFSLGASAILATRNYRDIAALNGDGVERKQISAFASLSLKRFGSAGIAYAAIDQDSAPANAQLGILPGVQSHVLSANYSVQVHHASIYATEFRSFASGGDTNGLQIGVTIPLHRRSSADVSATSGGDAQVQVQKSVVAIGDWGYDAFVATGSSNHQFAQLQYKSPIGLYTAGIDSSGGETTLRLESQGAISFVDHGLFASNQIYDSFAIVDTSPMPHVHVLQENRDVGTTNASGRLLVPDMRAFDINHLTIEATDIPPDVTINDATRNVRPQQLSGVVVRFPIQFSHGALVQLVDAQGKPLPLGSTAALRSSAVAYPVGYDGDAYLENLSTHNEITVERNDGKRCSATFNYKPVPGEIPTIGPVRCVEQEQP
jgi:outer membrane usher protein